jgi:hypothetical protein
MPLFTYRSFIGPTWPTVKSQAQSSNVSHAHPNGSPGRSTTLRGELLFRPFDLSPAWARTWSRSTRICLRIATPSPGEMGYDERHSRVSSPGTPPSRMPACTSQQAEECDQGDRKRVVTSWIGYQSLLQFVAAQGEVAAQYPFLETCPWLRGVSQLRRAPWRSVHRAFG